MTEAITLSCASLHKPSLADLSSLPIPKGSIVPLSPQVRPPGLAQSHCPSAEPPLSLLVYCGCGTAGDLWHWALCCCPAGHPTKLSSVCVHRQWVGRDKTKEDAEAVAYLAFPSWFYSLTLERKVLSQCKKFSCLHSALPQAQEMKWCSASSAGLCLLYILYKFSYYPVQFSDLRPQP